MEKDSDAPENPGPSATCCYFTPFVPQCLSARGEFKVTIELLLTAQNDLRPAAVSLTSTVRFASYCRFLTSEDLSHITTAAFTLQVAEMGVLERVPNSLMRIFSALYSGTSLIDG